MVTKVNKKLVAKAASVLLIKLIITIFIFVIKMSVVVLEEGRHE